MSLKQLIFLIVTVGYFPFAFGKETYFIVNYESSENDTIRKIYSQFLEDVFKLANNHNSILMTKENNPQVTNWKKIPAGVKLRIYVGVDDLDKKKFFEYEKRTKNHLRKIDERENYQSLNYVQGLKSSIYYMFFMGDVKQSNSVDADVAFTQKGVITLGWQGNYYFPISNHSIGMGISFSELDMTKSNYGSGSIDYPTEVNAYTYGEYRSKDQGTTFLYGVDYEKSSSFDLSESNNQGKIVLEDNSLIYGTLGIARSIGFSKTSIFTKLTLSKTLISKSSSGKNYSGYKTNFYINKKMNKDFYIFSNFRYQNLSTSSDLQVIRLGFGFGVLF